MDEIRIPWFQNGYEVEIIFIYFSFISIYCHGRTWYCCRGYNHPPKFLLACKFRSLTWILQSFILGHLLVSWWFQTPLLDPKSCPRSHLYATYVISRHSVCCFSCKGNVVLLQGKACAHEWLSSHRHVSHPPHPLLSRRLLHQAKYVLCILDGLRCVTKCPCVITVKSYHVYICFIDLTLSYFPEQPSLVQLPRAMRFASTTIKLPPLPIETSQSAETPTSLACWNPAARSDPSQHCSPKMSRAVKQPTLLSKNAQSSPAALHSEIA